MDKETQHIKLFISLPGSTNYQVFKADDQGSQVFAFVTFDGTGLRLPVEKTEYESFVANYASEDRIPTSPGREAYESLVNKAIQTIRQEGLGKIVTSRPMVFPMKLEPLSTFKKLVRSYPRACVYLFTHPDAGTWMGATPETLLVKKDNTLMSMSLAGTRLKGQEETFTAKEEEEQQLVTDFIGDLFRSEDGIERLKINGPKPSGAGNLVHLKSEISALVNRGFELQGFLQKLHPTPAVAGLPRDRALNFLRQNEMYHRTYYSGYFGLEQGGNCHYFVNLRCMQLFEKQVVLYAGGGITKDSDPGSEWEETEFKMQTLLSLINPSVNPA